MITGLLLLAGFLVYIATIAYVLKCRNRKRYMQQGIKRLERFVNKED